MFQNAFLPNLFNETYNGQLQQLLVIGFISSFFPANSIRFDSLSYYYKRPFISIDCRTMFKLFRSVYENALKCFYVFVANCICSMCQFGIFQAEFDIGVNCRCCCCIYFVVKVFFWQESFTSLIGRM